MNQRIWIASLLFSLFSLVCCSTKPGNPPQNPQDPVEPADAVITVVSGNGQSGHGGSVLDAPIIVKVTGLDENPVPGVSVEFDVVEGDGAVPGGSSSISDADGQASIQWIIGSGYNGIEVGISDESYQAPSVYVYATGEHPTGLHVTRTIASLRRVEGYLYAMRFYGDYSNDLAGQRSSLGSSSHQPLFPSDPFHCSLFSLFGDSNSYLLGRNFDNPSGWRCLTLMTWSDHSFG
jgi:hypothetical protein